MFESHPQALLEFLRSQELDPPALARIEVDHAALGRSPALLAVEAGLMTRAGLLEAAAVHLGCEYVPETPAVLDPEHVRLLDPGLARLYGAIPFRGDAQGIDLLVVNPFDPRIARDLAFALGRDVRLLVTDPDAVTELIRRHYGEEASGPTGATAVSHSPGREGAEPGARELGRLAMQAPVIRLVDLVLAQAIREGASDVHFEPFEHEFAIRCRIDGALLAMPSPPHHLALPVISRLKVMANLNIAERRVPQDGRLKIDFDGRAVDLRLSTLPTQFGESVVLRVLDSAAARLDLDGIGLPASIRVELEAVIRRPSGILLVTGPTGSGKTTTLYSALRAINTADLKILTVEDPVEYEVEGVMQVGVLPGIGRTFAATLRAFLRQDPDVMMVGEIRDEETARVAIQAALTGHLVLATLHTNDAAGAVARLADMGIEPFLIAAAVEAVLAQRLVRRICRSCRATRPVSDEEWRRLGLDRVVGGSRECFQGRSCADCGQTGYRGRLGLYEWLPLTGGLRDRVAAGASALALKEEGRARGMTTLREAGLHALFDGETTIEEVLKYT